MPTARSRPPKSRVARCNSNAGDAEVNLKFSSTALLNMHAAAWRQTALRSSAAWLGSTRSTTRIDRYRLCKSERERIDMVYGVTPILSRRGSSDEANGGRPFYLLLFCFSELHKASIDLAQ